jgi:hypothetical protein
MREKREQIKIQAMKNYKIQKVKALIIVLLLVWFNDIKGQKSPSIVLPKTNCIYAGVDNLIILNGLNELSRPIVSTIQAIIKRIDGQRFYIKPNAVDSVKLIIRALPDTQFEFVINVEILPEPEPFLNEAIVSGMFKVSEISKIDSLTVAVKEADPKIAFGIDCFTVTHIRNNKNQHVINRGPVFGNKLKEIIKTARIGDKFIIDSISYFNDGKIFRLEKNIVLEIQQ